MVVESKKPKVKRKNIIRTLYKENIQKKGQFKLATIVSEEEVS